jgi:hypothetical protein
MTKRHHLLVAASAAAFAAACGPALPKPNLGPVSAVEITESGEALAIPPTGITEVDVNSSIQLKIDKAAAQKKLALAAGVDSGKIEPLKERSQKLTKIIKSERNALDGLQRIVESPPKTLEETRKALRTQGALEQAALDALEQIRTREELNQLLRNSNHYSVVITELEIENGKLIEELNALTAKLSRVGWRVQAVLYNRGSEHALHLPGYDDLPEGELNVINKLAIPTNLLAVLDRTKANTAELEDLKDALNKARAKAEQRAKDVRVRLLKVAEQLEAIPKIVDDAKKSPWAGIERGKQLRKDLEELGGLVKTTLAACKAGFAQARSLDGASLGELVRVTASSSSPLRQCLKALLESSSSIVQQAEALPSAVQELQQAIESDSELAKKVGGKALADLSALSAKLRADTALELMSWWNAVQGLGDGPVFGETEHLKDRAYSDVADTSIELTRSARARGDYVYYRSASVNSGTVTERFSSAPLRVVTTGWHVNVSGSVVFVRALEHQAQDSDFPAAPAATAALHYGSRRGSNEQHGSRFWNFVDPGIGLHMAYLDLGPKASTGDTSTKSDPAMEFGVGGVVQLFGDVLQGGIAYDLQAARSYWFFGIGLQTATNFGLTTSVSGK